MPITRVHGTVIRTGSIQTISINSGSFTSSVSNGVGFLGTSSWAQSSSFAVTSSYSLAGSGFPFSGSAVITGSLLISSSGITLVGGNLTGTSSFADSASFAPVGPGTSQSIALFNSSNTLTSSIIFQSGSNIGVNTNSPQARFHVNDSASATTAQILVTNNSTRTGIRFGSSSLTAGKQHYLYHRTDQTTAEWIIEASPGETAQWRFQPQDNSAFSVKVTAPRNGGGTARILSDVTHSFGIGANNVSDIIWLTGSGNVGIGTTSPDANLTVQGQASFNSGSLSNPGIAARGDLNTGIYFPTTDTIGFVEGGSEAMRIDSSGRVGIGTTLPTESLDLNGTFRSYNGASYEVIRHGSFTLNDGTLGNYNHFMTVGVTTARATSIELTLVENNIGHSVMKFNIMTNYDDVSATPRIVLPTYSTTPRFTPTGSYGAAIHELHILNEYEFRLVVKGIGNGSNAPWYWTAKLKNCNVTDTPNTTGVDSTSYGIYRHSTITQRNQNFGVGVDIPSAKFQVQGNISASSYTSSISNAVGFVGTSSWAVSASRASSSVGVDVLSGGSTTALGIYSGSFFGTSSWATTASNAITASFALNAGSGAGFPFNGNAVITGSLLISGSGLSVIGTGVTASGIVVTSSFGQLFTSSSASVSSGISRSFTDTGLFANQIGNHAIYEMHLAWDPNVQGSPEYRHVVIGDIIVMTNWNGTDVTSYIGYNERYALSSGSIGVQTGSVDVLWVSSSGEERRDCPVKSSTNQIRIKYDGFTLNTPVQNLRLTRKL